MANWQSGAAFSNSFLNTIQALSAFENAQMQNDRLQQQMKREKEYETALSEESTAAKGIGIPTAVQQGVQFKDFTNDSGEKVTAAQQQQALQSALANPNLSNEERLAALKGYAGTEYATPTDKGGIDLAGLKSYQTAGGETKFNQLGREASQSDVYNRVRQRMSESGNIHGQEQALKMGKLTREDELATRKHDLMVNYAKDEDALKGYVASKDVAGMVNYFGPRIAAGTGQSVNLVTKPNGKQMVELVNSKGKVTESFPADAKTLGKHIAGMGEQDFMSQYARLDPEYALKKKGQEITEQHYKDWKQVATGKQGGGGAGGIKGFQQKVNDYSTLLFQSGQTNPKTGKPFTEAEAKQHTMAVMLKDTGLVGTDTGGSAVKSLGEGLVQVGRQVYQQDQKTGEWVPAKGLPGSGPDKYAAVLGGKDIDTSRPGTPAAPAAPQQAIPTAKPDLSNWTMKPAGKTMFGETDYVLTAPNGTRMSLGDFVDRYGYNPSAEFIGRR